MLPDRVHVLLVRGIVAWAVFGALGYFLGPSLSKLLFPAYEMVAEAFLPNFAVTLSIRELNGTQHIHMDAIVTKPLVLTPKVTVPLGREVPASITVLHSMVPSVILLALLVAWPAQSLGRLFIRILIGLVSVVLVQLAINPAHLAGNLERGIQSAVGQLGGEPSVPFVLRWMLFMEGGGRWVLPLVAAVSCILVTEPKRNRTSDDRSVGSN